MNENIKSANPLGTQKESKLLVKFAIPCIISMLVTALYNIVDQIFIGQGIGINGNAATNITFPRHVQQFPCCSESEVRPMSP